MGLKLANMLYKLINSKKGDTGPTGEIDIDQIKILENRITTLENRIINLENIKILNIKVILNYLENRIMIIY